MTRDDNYSPFRGQLDKYAPRTAVRARAGDHVRIRCELRDHRQYGVEAQILHDEEPIVSRTFAPWHVEPLSTPRAAAIRWAEELRKDIEAER